MTAVSVSPDEKARKYLQIVLHRLSTDTKQTAVALAMGVSDSTIHRLREHHLEPLCRLLAHLGLKIVPAEMQCFEPEKIEAILTFAKAYMDQLSANDLRGDL